MRVQHCKTHIQNNQKRDARESFRSISENYCSLFFFFYIKSEVFSGFRMYCLVKKVNILKKKILGVNI